MIRYVMSISTCTHISHPSPSIRLLILKREDLSFSYWNVILEGVCTCTHRRLQGRAFTGNARPEVLSSAILSSEINVI